VETEMLSIMVIRNSIVFFLITLNYVLILINNTILFIIVKVE
jgi:hypothetical protein